MATGNMKGYFRQKKGTGVGIAKSKPNSKTKASSSSSSSKKSLTHAAALGSDITQPSALISHASPDLRDDYDEHENVLRQFDMNMAYGPCIGMSRLARWERANSLGMNPPKDIEGLLRSSNVGLESLWDGRV